MKRYAASFVPVLYLAIILIGCGSDNGGSAQPAALDEISTSRLSFITKDIIPIANGLDGTNANTVFIDLNQDGATDMIISDASFDVQSAGNSPTQNQSLLVFYKQSGNAIYSAPRRLVTQVNASAVYPIRLFRDPRTSLLLVPVVDPYKSGRPFVYLLNGDTQGGFAAASIFWMLDSAVAVSVADLDLDGLDDLLAAFPSLGKVGIWRGLGGGYFAGRQDLSAGMSPSQLKSGDLNRDGQPDLLTVSRSGTGYLLGGLLRSGSGYLPMRTSPATGTPQGLHIADVDRDGIADAVYMSAADADSPADLLIVARGRGDGTFTELAPISIRQGAASTLLLDDFDADGKIDISYVSNVTNIVIQLGNGTGKFEAAQPLMTFPIIAQVDVVGSVDYDSDGRTDLIALVQYYKHGWVRAGAVLRNVSAGHRAAGGR